ncbi:hypothetical protein HHI36_006658 [Cryptolaemus montrouzieri]|uniref:Uncharacterized protein n=1 Tax=Cryptolaemus montrouzieri TaxID=559131 RepID=A0ABD2NXR1_9CUCU
MTCLFILLYVTENGIYNVTTLCQVVKKGGDDYLKRINTFLEANFEKVVFNFQNLFGGNKQLGDQVNMFLNENWEYLLGDYGPGIAELLRAHLARGFDAFADQVPIKDFFIID